MKNYSGNNKPIPIALINNKKYRLVINLQAIRFMYDNYVDKSKKEFRKCDVSIMFKYLTDLFDSINDGDIDSQIRFCTEIASSCTGGRITREDIEKLSAGSLIGLLSNCVAAYNYSIVDYIQRYVQLAEPISKKKRQKSMRTNRYYQQM